MYDMKKDFSWFCDNRHWIIAGHEGKRVAIKDGKVLGYYETDEAAVEGSQSAGLKLGEYIVQRCLNKEDDTEHYYMKSYTQENGGDA